MKAILMVSHGSRYKKTLCEIQDLARDLKLKIDGPIFEYAFLDMEAPSIAEGLDRCVRQGARDILVLLNFLNSGQHVDYDIPEILEKARQRHPGVEIRISRPVGQHPGMREVFLQIIQAV
jgi:sirohydrochlorin ferrochelatase